MSKLEKVLLEIRDSAVDLLKFRLTRLSMPLDYPVSEQDFERLEELSNALKSLRSNICGEGEVEE